MSEKMENFPYGRQSISSDDIRAVTKALKKPFITRGEITESFEKQVASYCNVPHAVSFSSGSAALAAAMFAAEVSGYDKVLTTPNSFISTIGGAVGRGATPIFVDIDRKSGNLNLDLLLENLNPYLSRGKMVVLPVHFAGIAVDMKKISNHILHPSTVIIEDAAHALGSLYPSGEKVGSCSYSDMTIFSFHPVKNITTGEGGMVTTANELLAKRLRLFRNNGIEREKECLEYPEEGPWYYEVHELSNNYHMTEFQAALGTSQLKKLDSFIKKRRDLVKKYYARWKDKEGITLFDEKYISQTAFHLFVMQIDFQKRNLKKAEVMQKLKEKKIYTQVHYIPLYRHPIFTHEIGDLSPYFPEMETYYEEALSLPLFYDLKDQDIDYISDTLESILA